MNKYQEALDRQKNNVKKLRDKEFVEYREDFAILQELIDQNKTPTEEEVLKEFEALGYKIYKEKDRINIIDKFDINGCIFIFPQDKTYRTNMFMTVEIYQLLTKLFKAWGWLK